MQGRLTLFWCLMVSGIALDAYFTWDSFRFHDACFEVSGNRVPVSIGPFTLPSLLAAAASIALARNRILKYICLGLWMAYCVLCALTTSEPVGINCFKDVGGAMVVSFAFTVLFAALILVLTFVNAMIGLARRRR
jgi:hypothetical protein